LEAADPARELAGFIEYTEREAAARAAKLAAMTKRQRSSYFAEQKRTRAMIERLSRPVEVHA
jgi:hypothetical protein